MPYPVFFGKEVETGLCSSALWLSSIKCQVLSRGNCFLGQAFLVNIHYFEFWVGADFLFRTNSNWVDNIIACISEQIRLHFKSI